MARVASTTTDEGALLGELTTRILYWLVTVALSPDTKEADIASCVSTVKMICTASVPAQFEVARLVISVLGSVENTVFNNQGMTSLLGYLYFRPPVELRTKSKRTIPFHNHITGIIAERKSWSEDMVEKLADQLSSLPCTTGVSFWIVSLIKALSRQGRVSLLQKLVFEIATNISNQYNEIIESDTPKASTCETAQGCATVLSFLLVGYQKSNALQHQLYDTVSQAISYAERHAIKPEAVLPPYRTLDILKPSRSSIIRLAYGFAASVLYFNNGGQAHANVITFVYRMLPQGAIVKLAQPEREFSILRGPGPKGVGQLKANHPPALRLNPTPKPITRRKLQPGITGLLNLGNTCFMASYLQALYFTPSLRKLLLAFHSSPSLGGNASRENSKLLGSISTLFGCMELTSATYLKPQNVYRALPAMFTNYRQHDSSEFGIVLLSNLEREITAKYGTRDSSTHPGSIANFPRHVTGEIVSTTTCGKCKTERSRKEDYVGLNLMYDCEDTITDVQDLLDSTLDTTEGLWGENKYQCDTCNQKTDATKNTYVARVPNTLILSLGRFRYDPKLGIRRKICTPTMFSETLSVRNKTYQLTAIVAHSGPSSYGGHYYCIAKDPTAGWVECNDSRCELIDGKVNSIFTRTDVPYILFYSKATVPTDEEDLYGDCVPEEVDSEEDLDDDQPPLQLLTELPSFKAVALSNPSQLTESSPSTSMASSKLTLD